MLQRQFNKRPTPLFGIKLLSLSRPHPLVKVRFFKKPNNSFMPENIFKLYRPSKKNEDKSWHNESEEDRFQHVCTALSRYCYGIKDYDYLDLVWSIKNAVIGDIYFSKKVYQGIKDGLYWNQYIKIDDNGVILPVKTPETDQYRIIRGIIERTTLQDNGVFDDTFLEIRKWTGKEYSGVSGNSDDALVFEHVIPAKVYLHELIKEYKDKNTVFNQEAFHRFRNKVSVCIITKEEDKSLNDKGYREKMPDRWIWQTGNRFARYEEVGINIHENDIRPTHTISI